MFEITTPPAELDELATLVREAIISARQAGWADARDVYANDNTREIFAEDAEAAKAKADELAREMWRRFYDYAAAR